MYRVAVVEDHARLAELICRSFAAIGIGADVFSTIDAAWSALRVAEYSAFIIDRGLPDGDGLELVRQLRSIDNRTPCLVLTSRDALRDRVDGLSAGADDYMTKPFRMDELIARLRTLMRRPEDHHAMHIEFGDVRLYPAQACFVCQDGSVRLSSAELHIIWCLFRQAGRFVHRRALHAAAWGMSDAPSPDALDLALDRLRAALLEIGSVLRIVDIHGDGHALRDDGQTR